MRRHSRTQRRPREHFEAVEAQALRPAPTAPYDIPLWASPKVARDQLAQVARALYSLPTRWVGKRLSSRADRSTVRFYDSGILVKTHPRKAPGERSIDPTDYRNGSPEPGWQGGVIRGIVAADASELEFSSGRDRAAA